ncbi:hypothetical protein BD414DRAFT_80131 [Trametes punicea]|nr:hypothetical protein BD414DRAFT_80131 [Trametes punicea]
MSQQSDTTELNDNLDNLILILQPPEPASSVERRAADVLRRRIVATSDLPTPGIYLTNPYNPKKPFYVVGGLSGQPNQAASSLQTQVPPSASDDGSTTLAAPSNELDFQEQRLDSWEAPDGLSSVKKARPRASTKMPANRRQLAASFHSGTLLQVDGFQRLPGSERISERYYRTTIYVPMQDLPEGVESWQVVKGDRLSASFKVTVDTGASALGYLGLVRER